MYDKKIYKRDVTCSWPSPCHKLSHLLGHLPSSVTYFMDGPYSAYYTDFEEFAVIGYSSRLSWDSVGNFLLRIERGSSHPA